MLGHLSLREFPVYISLFYMLKTKFLLKSRLLEAKTTTRVKGREGSAGREEALESPADFCTK